MKLVPKKSLGQNFLIEHSIVNLIVETAKIDSEDFVIEVGPGRGILTEQILTISFWGKSLYVHTNEEAFSNNSYLFQTIFCDNTVH